MIDDYGHHPAEIRATLDGAPTAYPESRIIVIMQPHRFTRLRDHFDEFSRCMHGADRVVITEVYAAGEAPIAGVDGQALVEAATLAIPGRVEYWADYTTLPEHLGPDLRAGDIVLTLGAGSITHLGPQLVEYLRKARAAADLAARPGDSAPS